MSAPEGAESLKRCSDCGERKPRSEFYGRGAKRKDPSNRCKACQAIVSRRWVEEHPEESALLFRKAWLKRYNMTLADYDNLLAAQGGRCAICKTGVPGGTGRFHIDHDHACCPERMRSCGKCVRGLLCSYCNMHLAGDNPRRLRAALNYIENFRRRSAMQGGLGASELQTLPWCNG